MRGHKRLRTFLQARRSGATVEAAAFAADMGLREAELHDAVEQEGGYAEIRVTLKLRGDNGPAAADQLRIFVERVERLNGEIKGLQEDKKLVLQEAKVEGFRPDAIAAVIKLREQDADTRAENDTILELYREALGID